MADAINPMVTIAPTIRMRDFVAALKRGSNNNCSGEVFMFKFQSDSNDVPVVLQPFLPRRELRVDRTARHLRGDWSLW